MNTNMLTKVSHFKYSVVIADAYSHFTVAIRHCSQNKNASAIIKALASWATSYGPNAKFNLSEIAQLQIATKQQPNSKKVAYQHNNCKCGICEFHVGPPWNSAR